MMIYIWQNNVCAKQILQKKLKVKMSPMYRCRISEMIGEFEFVVHKLICFDFEACVRTQTKSLYCLLELTGFPF